MLKHHLFRLVMLCLFVAGAVLWGCMSIGPRFSRPDIDLRVPSTYKNTAPANSKHSLSNLCWWELFPLPGLEEIIREVRTRNWDIKEAAQKVLGARFRLRQARADLFPQISIDAKAQRQKSPITGPPGKSFSTKTDTFMLSAAASYELDSWGRVAEQRLVIKGQGAVRPVREIDLVPEVAGKVIYVSPSLLNGGQFKAGETLVKIDPVDYELAVILARARVREAQSTLELLEEESSQARTEWEMNHSADPVLAKNPPPLLVKGPQIAAARAQLEAARADLRRALLNLKRTEIVSLFDGRVITAKVGIGQYVKPGQVLAKVYSTEAVEISVPLQKSDIAWFHVPGLTPGRGLGAKALVRAKFAGKEMVWEGRVLRSEGKIDEHTRMVNVIVRVDRPYQRRPPLAVGLFVDVDIQGRAWSKGRVCRKRGKPGADLYTVTGRRAQKNKRNKTLEALEAKGRPHS